MSPLLKSELRLRVGPRHCVAEVFGAGLAPRRLAQAFAEDVDGDPLDAALAQLDEGGAKLPSRARLLVEDELMFFALSPADGPWREAAHAARMQFRAVLDNEELLVAQTLAQGGAQWINAALAADAVDAWRARLADRGIALGGVRAALVEDLRQVGGAAAPAEGLWVMVRSEGIHVVELAGGGVIDLSWERCDVDDLPALTRRISARTGRPGGAPPAPVVITPHRSSSLPGWQAQAQLTGWRLTPAAIAQ